MKRTLFSDEIREAIRRSGRSYYDIATQMGVAPSTVWRFLQGKNGLSLALLDRLADAIDLHATIGLPRKEK
jgi:transcriptional regulator with XRE-family HTH domain